MPSAQQKHTIVLSPQQEKQLIRIGRAHSTPQGKALRARIILTAGQHPEWNNQQIAASQGCTDRTVRTWRKRWGTSQDLDDLPRPGGPRTFPLEVRAQTTAVACTLPRQQQVPLARWFASAIVRRLIELQIVPSISVSTVTRWLAQERIKPWQHHSWQKILDPQQFLKRARPVLHLYQRVDWLLARGVWAICVDEKTSIQARSREAATTPAEPGKPVRYSSRYQRKGALQLFAALSLADGKVIGRCMSRRCFKHFKRFLLQSVLPEAKRRGVHTIAMVLDNGSTHAPKRLLRWWEEEMTRRNCPIKLKIYWLPPNASWLDQIEIWFSVLQRRLLTPNDFPQRNILAREIMSYLCYHNNNAQPIRWSYTAPQLQRHLQKVGKDSRI